MTSEFDHQAKIASARGSDDADLLGCVGCAAGDLIEQPREQGGRLPSPLLVRRRAQSPETIQAGAYAEDIAKPRNLAVKLPSERGAIKKPVPDGQADVVLERLA